MKIVFSTDTLSKGGKERIMAILASYLINQGRNLVFLSKMKTSDTNNYFDEYRLNNELIVPYGKGFLKYYRAVKNLNPDLIYSWDVQSSLYNLLLYKRLGYSYINGSIRHGIRLFKWSHLLRSLVCHLSPFVIANSISGLKANNLKPGERRLVLYNGIDSKFRNNLTKQEIISIKEKLIPGYIDRPGLVYISVANFVPYKDYFTVLKALARLKRDNIFYYLVLGDGPLRIKIEKAITKYSLEDRVILAGRRENVREYLFASDLMIHSSRGEGISNAILEGMYAGLPVIASDVGGVTETIFPGSSMLFAYKDHETLYKCLLKSHDLKRSFNPCSAEYQAHLGKFSHETMSSSFEEIMNKVLIDTQKGNDRFY